MFHEKCGTLLKRKTTEKGVEIYCPSCNDIVPEKLIRKSEKIVIKANSPITGFPLINDDPKNAPIEHKCDGCDFDRAYEYILPPIRGDEDETIMYKCAKCGKVSRENTKIM
ncbi:MAG: hypothetical protein M1500_01275 [Candidatus Marsarchaeota archaeon]|nr:hypothetical protein [Candidatus Marsarchaeota archaeon]